MWVWIVEHGPGLLAGGLLIAILFFVYVINDQLEDIRRNVRSLVQLLGHIAERDR